MNANGSPTVVLVHGAFADASSWNGVIKRLQEKGLQVTAPANPVRGISIDSASAVEFAIDPAKFCGAFAADLPDDETAVMAATQRPVTEVAFSEQSGAPTREDDRRNK